MNGYVEIVEGVKGSGKTTWMVEQVVEHLQAGGWCYTNVEVWADKVRDRMLLRGYIFEEERLKIIRGDFGDFYKIIGRGTADDLVLVVIDEAALRWENRDFRDTPKELNSLNALVRKLDIRLIYGCQNAIDLDKKFRGQADVLWQCRNLRKFHLGPIPMPIPLFARVPWYYGGGAHGKPTKGAPELIWRSWAWGLFDSDALLGPQAAYFANLRIHKRTPLKRCKIPKKMVAQSVSKFLRTRRGTIETLAVLAYCAWLAVTWF
jgi:hypothetical protein